MKKAAIWLCGFLCVLFIGGTAFAKPPKANRLAQVGRNGVTDSYQGVRDKARKATHVRHRSSRPHALVNRPSHKGDVWGKTSSRRQAASHYTRTGSSRAKARLQQIMAAKTKSKVRCVEGVSCGRSAMSKRSRSASTKSSSFLNYSEAQKARWKKIRELHSEMWKPPQVKELESGCNDFASCL